ncbi:MAG: DNA polymerase III subunit beta [Candidatus Gracilibacteria bacterium]|nr:DNA polymerase III subunit beta [Candidatus Gracilibacteria bacterium]
MKFSVKTVELKKGLDIVNHATAGVTTTPILESILIRVNYSDVILTSNNLETAIEYTIKNDLSIKSEGSYCIPSKLFTSYVSLLSDDEIEIELVSDSIIINTESGKLKIKGTPAEDFPLIPTIKEETSFSISGKVLRKAIEKTVFSAAEGNIRPTLAGILVNLKGTEAICASTDSFRLSEYKMNLGADNMVSFSQIVPSRTAYEIKSILKDDDSVKIISGDSQIAFFFGNTKFFSRLLNGKFPDYSSFFPTNYSTKAEINKADLMQALKKINLVSKENNYSIKMSFSSETGIVLETSETQIGEGEIKLTGAIEGEDNIIGINSTYFLEVLGVIETTHVSISFESPLAPILITPLKDPEREDDKSSFRHIIMPLKI